jgi:hypothetical protein
MDYVAGFPFVNPAVGLSRQRSQLQEIGRRMLLKPIQRVGGLFPKVRIMANYVCKIGSLIFICVVITLAQSGEIK